MEPVERIDLGFVTAAVGQSLLRKVAGYAGGVGDRAYADVFHGFSEQDVVVTLGRILDAIGYDVYYEYRYPHGGRVDIYAESWDGDAIWAEVKILMDSKDMRLNAARYHSDTGEFRKDVRRFLTIEDVPGHHLLIIVGFSPCLALEHSPTESKSLRIGDVVDDITQRTKVSPTWHRSSLASRAPTAEHTRVLHTIAWTKSIPAKTPGVQ